MSDSLSQNAFKGIRYSTTALSEHDLLFELGLRGMQRLAGYIPSITKDGLPKIAPADEKNLCSERTTRQFLWLMGSNYRGLRTIWVKKFAETGQRLPDELLPSLMDSQRSTFGNLIPPQVFQKVVGKRAQWLANLSQNKHWLWFNSEDGLPPKHKSRFRNIKHMTHYRQLRSENLDEAALWLDDNWILLASDDRLNALNSMSETLTMNDLPFLLIQIDEIKDTRILGKVWYMVSLLKPKILDDMISKICHFVGLDFMGQSALPVLDFRWANTFLGHPQHIQRGELRKLAAQHVWWDSLAQLIRLVPLDYWLQKWETGVEELLNGARNGFHGDLFISIWIQRAIDESHEAFALEILRHQRPISYFLGWRISKQSKLLEQLSFKYLQILLDETWMQTEKGDIWQIR